MPVQVNGSGGGSVTLDAGAASAATTLTLPNTNGTLVNTAPGTSGNGLISNGSAWTSAPALVNVQPFTSSGTWNRPTGYGANSRVFIQCWGGGGSGGKISTSCGGGGGGGGYNERWMLFSDMTNATETVTVGAGGSAQATNAANGNVGGTTSFGSKVSAYGGSGGGGVAASGGGGGGQLTAGTAVTSSFAGYGGLPFGNPAGNQGTGADSTPTAANPGYFNGGGGGCGAVAGGAASVWGGGGGGVIGFAAGTSSFAGAGGAGGTTGTAGTAPSGGGGGSGSGNSGAGGAGQVIVTVFPG
ncbi:hypothetical protein UFOVP231_25 [uncultured Caudovirales phage]|uniref:Glycine-rich domain-containing protein n=1 Tax=uncultured Caudovirales phage TaxID=2100421 RepID=A0A6J7WT28_9CAUD|nr:hypothetical protein UFOVP231_25 [uncultured Caudovirales phage]